ncbi:aldo/keto reductase [Chloroflexota bacterium]
MKYRALGRTGIEVSELGFGTWGIGGNSNDAVGYGPTSDEESRAALQRAFELGVNFYDTADLYGFGHSEELLGEIFASSRQDVIIASKVGFVNFDEDQDFSPRHIREAIEGSLKRLETDYIDLYQLHSPSVDMLENDPAIMSALESLKQDGKTRFIGLSVRSPGDGIIAVEKFNFDTIQVNCNLVDQRALEIGLLDSCEAKGIGVIIRTPLSYGFLTGAYTADTLFDPQDQRSKWSPQQIEKWADSYKIFIDDISSSGKSTSAQFALRFCLSCPVVSTVIPGMLTVDHVEENIASSQLGSLSEVDFQSVIATYRSNEFFVTEN